MHNRQANAKIDTYSDRVAAQLARVPADRRDEQIEELRQHLEALSAQYEEVGVLPSEASEEAIGQFGDPVRLGQRLLREWRLTERHLARERHAPVRYALKALVWTSVFCFWFCDPLLAHFHSTWFPSDSLLVCFVPVFAGALTGWRWPERGFAAFFRAMVILVVAALGCLVFGFLIACLFHGLSTGKPPDFAMLINGWALAGLPEFFLKGCLRWLGIWMPLGLLAAFLSGMAKRRVYVPKSIRRM